MDATKALADLKEISTQVRQAVLLDSDGKIAASTAEDERRAQAIADAASRLVAAVEEATKPSGKPVSQIEAKLEDGSVAIVREGGLTIAATTGPEPTIGLVFYDLRTCLRGLAEEPPKRKRTPRKKTPKETGAA